MDGRWITGPDSTTTIDNLISKAFSFFGVFMRMRDRWLKLAAEMPRYHRWPNYEVLELLKSDGKLDGFRVHFLAGSSARFRRATAGVDVMNVIFKRDGTINFMVGLLDAVKKQYVVDGREVQFGSKKAVNSFDTGTGKFRVVRHTFNARGKLAEHDAQRCRSSPSIGGGQASAS